MAPELDLQTLHDKGTILFDKNHSELFGGTIFDLLFENRRSKILDKTDNLWSSSSSPTLFSIYINDVPAPDGEDEKTLLFADFIVYCFSYKYKENKKLIESASNNAAMKAQVFLNGLESWMDLWRLSLAPHKCAQTTFTKAIRNPKDDLQITIYGQKINYDHNPKFLGITFDSRLGFEKHFEKVKDKVKERINVLKVLSYDKSWSLNVKFLLSIYKVLIRSVMDYANVITAACNEKVVKELEVLQNDALRVIFKKSILDHVPVQTLLDWAELETIKSRHESLLTAYYEKCLVSNNPLIKELFEKYKIFKRRKLFSEDMAVGERGTVDLDRLALIRKVNVDSLNSEIHSTTLCKAKPTIKEIITDSYGFGPVGSGYR